ncbi:uncharacterized protein F4807DRAFT_433451 [Annulohypoxylon truncatum]|uniref:uncharacterized protein n=1 Tax=Annulohypoxylon truncatum TaxID=327061 RepID=UPI0020085F21|nr:uncharacterized protein F4807DRAFT_433451 [Annulohypoxylon truncatum]KAI1207828.1 hypothetical protein F4807DRAFT_433451 [Annulohypoxylon truncatum]
MSSSQKSWECSFPGCGKKFSRKEHLTRHNLGHNPEHQYKCHICGRRYARSDVFKRHVKQHNPQDAQSPDARRICLACGDRNTPCDGNSPCGACISNWTNCRWIDSDNSHATTTEQAVVVPSNAHAQTTWFQPNADVWMPQPFLATNPYLSSVPNNLNPDRPIQGVGAIDSTSYTPPTSDISGTNAEPMLYEPSNNPLDSPQLTPPLTSSQQRNTSRSPESAGAADLQAVVDRTSPETQRLIQLFFAEIDRYWPILHSATFRLDETSTTLLASMIMLASWLEGGHEHHKLAPLIFEEVNRIRTDITPSLQLLQSVLLYIVYATSNLTTDGMIARALNLVAWLISTCRYLGIFSGQHACQEMLGEGCPFMAWRAQEQLNRLAFAVLRVDAYLSVLLDHPPLVRYQELCIPLPKSRELWAAANEPERRKLQWNEPAGREKALFSFFMRDALNPSREGALPYCLTDIDYHLSTCATQTHIWEAAREAHSAMSDEIVEETDPKTFVQRAYPHLDLWRDKRRENCEILHKYFAGNLPSDEHRLGPLTFTLMYMSNLKLHSPMNVLRVKGHYYKSRPGAAIPTRKPRVHLNSWMSSVCPRSALWNAAQVCRIFLIESGRFGTSTDSNGNMSSLRSRARLHLNPLLIPGVLMSAIVACSYVRYTRTCGYCRAAPSPHTPCSDASPNSSCTAAINTTSNTNITSTPPFQTPLPFPNTAMTGVIPEEEAVNLFSLRDDDPVLLNWKRTGNGVPYWGIGETRIPLCACRLQDIAAWFREAFAEDEGAEMEFVIFLAELSRES